MKKKAVIICTIVVAFFFMTAIVKRFSIPRPSGHVISDLPAKYGQMARQKDGNYWRKGIAE